MWRPFEMYSERAHVLKYKLCKVLYDLCSHGYVWLHCTHHTALPPPHHTAPLVGQSGARVGNQGAIGGSASYLLECNASGNHCAQMCSDNNGQWVATTQKLRVNQGCAGHTSHPCTCQTSMAMSGWITNDWHALEVCHPCTKQFGRCTAEKADGECISLSAFRRGGPANQCKRITSQHHTIKHERKVLKMYKI
jgi:hypothetical protein